MAFTNPHREAEFNQWRHDRAVEFIRQQHDNSLLKLYSRLALKLVAAWLFWYGLYWLSYAVLKLMLLARSVGIPQG